MFFIEYLTIVLIICCIAGIGWLFYDMKKLINEYAKAEQESTLGLVEEDDDDK